VVNRLIVAAVYERESNDPINLTATDWFQVTPMYEGLTQIGFDGSQDAILAESWEMSPDMKTWTFHLRKGVQFHQGLGEFTSRDYFHAANHAAEEYNVDRRRAFWSNLLEKDRIVIVDDYTVVLNLEAPRIDLHQAYENARYNIMLSRDQYDAEGNEGLDDNPIGTGPYQYVERVLGSHVLYERVPYQHWRITPDFPELQILKVPESATRLAMLLADEAHITLLPRDLHPTAVNNGMEIIEATIPTTPVYTMFGGTFHADGTLREGSQRTGENPDLPYSDVFHPATELPWAHRKVRQALNLGVNREELRDTLFRGQGKFMPVTFYDSSLPGWNQEWMDNFDENYGYHPDRAKELLAEVEAEIGQPLDWSKTLFVLTIRPELPELKDMAEAVQNYWREIGADVKLEEREFAGFVPNLLSSTIGGIAWADATSRLGDPRMVELIFYSKSACCHFFESEFIDETYEKLIGEPDLAKRDQLLRDIGNHLHDEYATLPLFWFPVAFTVNPEVVADYPTPGQGPPRNLENVVAVKK
jgi:ABC-type transport system substrate-binding protein